MPKEFVFSAKEMQGNAYVSPFIAPVQAPSITLASDLASAGKQHILDEKGEKLRNDLTDQSAAFIGAQNDANAQMETLDTLNNTMSESTDNDAFTPHEQRLVKEAEVAAKKLTAARDQGKLTGAGFKAKVESTLKGYINSTPGLSAEFRKIASDTLGFDPSGSALKNAMTAADTTDKNQQSMELFLAKQLAGKGRYDTHLSVQANIAKHLPAFQQDMLLQEQEDLMRKQEGYEYEDQKRTQSQLLPATQRNRYLKNMSKVSDLFGGKPITAQLLTGLDANQRVVLEQQLQEMKADITTNLAAVYYTLTPEQRAAGAHASLNMIDNHLDWLSGDKEASMVENLNRATKARALRGIISTPATANFLTLLDQVPQGMELTGKMLQDANDLFDKLLPTGNPTPEKVVETAVESGLTEKQGEQLSNAHLQQVGKGFDLIGDDDITEGQVDAFVKHLKDISDPVWDQDPKRLKTYVMDNLFRAAALPSFSRVMDRVKDDPKLLNNITQATAAYIPRVFDSINAELNSVTGDRGWYELHTNKDGKVWFELGKPATDWYANHADTKDTKGMRLHKRETFLKVKALNEQYAMRLENVVSASARIGMEKDFQTVAATLFGSYMDMVPMSNQLKTAINAKYPPAE